MGEDKSDNNFSLVGLGGASKPLVESAGRIAEQVYGDAAKGPLQRVGELAGNAIRILNLPFEYVVKKGERLIAQSLSKVPEEHRVQAPLALIGPVLDGASYEDDDSLLHEMFVQLLSKGFDARYQGEAHPAFPKIIGQLSSDEARTLRYLQNNQLVSHRLFTRPGAPSILPGLERGEMFDDAEEFVSEILTSRAVREIWEDDSFVQYPNLELYRSHLEALGLVKSLDRNNARGEEAELGFYFLEGEKHTEENCFGIAVAKVSMLTMFGQYFVDACLPSEEEWTW